MRAFVFFLILLLSSTPLLAQETVDQPEVRSDDSFRLIGVGMTMSQSPYHGVDIETRAVPVIVWDHEKFFIKGVKAGYTVLESGDFKLNAVASPRFMGYHSSDSAALAGMEDREMSFDAGLEAKYSFNKIDLSAQLVNDVLSRHDGREGELAVSRKFASRIWQWTPAAGLRVQSSELTDYYFGVEDSEVISGRPAYSPGTAVNYFANSMFNFGIHKNWIVLTQVGIEFLDNDTANSPIVERDIVVGGVLGLTRRF